MVCVGGEGRFLLVLFQQAFFIRLWDIRVSQHSFWPGYLVDGPADEALRLVILEGRNGVVELGDVGVH